MKYRQFYRSETGVDIPDNYDIHHIDLDRSNNEITNLVALPKKLHSKTHQALYSLPSVLFVSAFQSIQFINKWNQLQQYYSTFHDVCLCIDFRNHLLQRHSDKIVAYIGYIYLHESVNYSELESEILMGNYE